ALPKAFPDLPSHPPSPNVPDQTITVSLPVDSTSFDVSQNITTVIIEPVNSTNIQASLNYIGFQGDFTYNPAVVSFSTPPAAAAGLTGSGWTVSANTLPGPGSLRTFRVSAFSNDGVTPLSGSG